MTNSVAATRQRIAPQLWVLPLIAAVCYPLFLRSAYGCMQLYAASQTSLDRAAALVSFVASLTAAFAVPLTAALCAAGIASNLNSAGALPAYRLAHLAFAAPPLFTALGVVTGMAGNSTDSPGIGALDYPIWILLWLCLGLVAALSTQHERQIEVRAPGSRWVGLHGVLALAVLLIFLAAHLFNHLFALSSPAAHGRVMQVLEVIYRAPVVEPLLVLCMLLLIVTGVTLAWRHTTMRGDLYRRVQTLTGVYLAAFILSHLTAIFLFARWQLGIHTNDWSYVSGAPDGLLRNAWNLRLIPHYALAVWAVMTHVGLGLRGVLRAHGFGERLANIWAEDMSAVGAIASFIITLGLIGVHLGGS